MHDTTTHRAHYDKASRQWVILTDCSPGRYDGPTWRDQDGAVRRFDTAQEAYDAYGAEGAE